MKIIEKYIVSDKLCLTNTPKQLHVAQNPKSA
jgi:hypothetical protein